ncbi:hypothetical protein [Bradyrhizobium sp. 613_E4_N2_2]|uniref:hypothetical protein n=1 Tax=Bradyrhizobium sp. 613_E4_N2_2 TaxID=3240371 RepID=UPI003F8976BF
MSCGEKNRLISGNATAGVDFSACVAVPVPGVSYTLHLRGPSVIDLTADSAGKFFAPAATTATWVAGTYAYSLRADASVEIDRDQISVLPDFLSMPAGTDVRSQAEIGLEAIDAVLAKRATQDQQRYVINNRELWRTPVADLLKLRQFYANQVARERQRRKGCGTFGRPILVRFHS